GFYETMGWNGFLRLRAQELADAMAGSFYSVYAYSGGTLVATGRIVSDGIISAYACGLGVLPEFRGQGVGAEIMNRLKAKCGEHRLHMQFFCGDALVPYYEKLGFEVFAAGMR
ncbi:MAG: GNAT family N-acetyltransferase, partial [Oscillospiraceae bacterium]|nr:GNAT family N-acetyltransferase [Oscillospiraceae bacterium]